ncbi:MAG: ribosome silencing factor [Clostridiales Family XIII bacterium]|nr:ribosome silencing factor [Clostridiales Family XIII bacterium]
MNNHELAALAGETISAKKGEDIILIDIAQQSSFADYFVNATATNERQLKALTEDVEEKLAEAGVLPKNIEGAPSSGWILMDYGDVIVNVFLPEQRDTYRIEKIWADSVQTRIE